MIIFVMLNRSVFIIIPQQQDVPYKIHYLYHVLTSNDKKANYAKSPKKRHLSQQVQTSLVYTTSTSFILAYSSITIEANSTNGFLTIFQMIKELNKEPVICINGLWLYRQLSTAPVLPYPDPQQLDHLQMRAGENVSFD